MNDRELFIAALQLKTDEERTAYLNEACGTDLERRQRIEKLLQRHEESESFLNPDHVERTAAFEHATASKPDTTPLETAGDLIGPFKLLQKLGDGGMGTVWVAEQEKPVKRRVALKLVKAGMDSAEVLRRFEAERQALAMMDHTNIAKVFDAGTNAQGRPYFVMELIKGVPITKYCDEVHASIRDRLDLFIQICSAVQHAHQKGIIHRDIKPSNVLVAMQDGKPVPKVIDFGVAKALHSKLADKTMYTEIGQVVGTLEYMAPEQAELSAMDIDTRADIYALGILLYELLTGSTPITRHRMKSAAFVEILRIIKEEEPPKPSTRLSESKESMASVASLRRTDPKHLSSELRGELDWVVLKALEKDRTRRYETANGLSRDLQRYLANETVEARPPSAGYRLQKFMKRNKGKVLAACLLITSLLAGIAGTTFGMFEARRQESIAREETLEKEKARAAEEQERHRADAEKKKAIEFRDRAVEALQATTGEDVENLLGEKSTLSDNEKAYLEAIIKRWQTFAEQEGNDEQSRALRAEGKQRIGFLFQKLGKYNESKSALDQAILIQENLVKDFAKNPAHRRTLVRTMTLRGRTFGVMGEDEKSFQDYRLSMLIGEKLTQEYPADDEAHYYLANSKYHLAVILNDKGHGKEAQPIQDQALAIFDQLMTRFPGDPKYRMSAAASHWAIAKASVLTAQRTSAEKHFQQALTHYEKLIADFPRSFKYRSDSTSTYRDYGRFLSSTGRVNEALNMYQKGLVLSEGLFRDYPGFSGVQGQLANFHLRLGISSGKLGKHEQSLMHLQKAIAIQEKNVQEHPEIPYNHRELTESYSRIGETFAQLNQIDKTLEYQRKAISVAEKLATVTNSSQLDLQTLAIAHGRMATTLRVFGRETESLEHHQQSLVLFEKLTETYPHSLKHKVDLAGNYCNIGVHYFAVNQQEEAIRWYNKGIELIQPILEKEESSAAFLCNCYNNRANALTKLKRYQEADADYLKAIELSPPHQKTWFRIWRCKMLVECGRSAEAMVEVENFAKSTTLSEDEWYTLAFIYANASEEETGHQIKYANQAVTLLERALKAGFQDRKELKTFSELPAMKDRDDVRRIIAEVKNNEQQKEQPVKKP